MPDIERYNDLKKLIRIMAYVLRFINYCRHSKQGNDLVRSPLTTHELCVGKNKLIYTVHREAFSEEIKALSSNKSISQSSKLAKLSLFLDDAGLLRVHGRLEYSDLSYDVKHTLIIPKCHWSELFVQFQHKFLKHAGVNFIISSLRTLVDHWSEKACQNFSS